MPRLWRLWALTQAALCAVMVRFHRRRRRRALDLAAESRPQVRRYTERMRQSLLRARRGP
jgi:hypothetical protein